VGTINQMMTDSIGDFFENGSAIHEISGWRHTFLVIVFQNLLIRGKFIAKVGEVTIE
jgi:hypothetical protein